MGSFLLQDVDERASPSELFKIETINQANQLFNFQVINKEEETEILPYDILKTGRYYEIKFNFWF